jgi:hypothetical protein
MSAEGENANSVSMTRRRFALMAASVLVAGGLMGAAVSWLASRRAAHATVHVERGMPIEPSDYIPSGVRGYAIADITRLRAAPALSSIFSPAAGGSEPCEARLIRGVRRVAVTFSGESFDEFAFAFAGGLSRDALVACARERRGGDAEVRVTHYRGFDAVRVSPRRDPALLPSPNAAQIVYLPSGVVLAGSSELVQRMADRGMASSDEIDASPLDALRRRLGGDHDVVLVGYVPTMPADSDEEIRALVRHVVGVAVGASFGEGMRATVVLACDDFDSPRQVADAIDRLRTVAAERFQLPALASAHVERRATDVRIDMTLSATELAVLQLGASELLEPTAPELPTTTQTPRPSVLPLHLLPRDH